MKLTSIYLTLLLALSLSSQAQHYEMLSAQDTIFYNPNSWNITTRSFLKNISGSTDTLFAKRIRNVLAMDHKTSFVWGTISLPHHANSSALLNAYVVLQDQQVDSTFTLLLFNELQGGTTEVTMRFFSMQDTSKYLDHNYVFVSEIASDISQDEIDHGYFLGSPYPNPSQDMIKLPYRLPADVKQASIQVINLEGKLMYEQAIHTMQEEARLQLGGIPGGLYMLQLIVEGRSMGHVTCSLTHP